MKRQLIFALFAALFSLILLGCTPAAVPPTEVPEPVTEQVEVEQAEAEEAEEESTEEDTEPPAAEESVDESVSTVESTDSASIEEAPTEEAPTEETPVEEAPESEEPAIAEESDESAASETACGEATFDSPTLNLLSCEEGASLDPKLFGTNMPAWVGPSNLVDDTVIQATQAAGVSMIRVPGGSWSNWYDWLACERGGVGIDAEAECFWPWAARPSDFIGFTQAIDGELMYTVRASNGGTAQEAAAAVAFFNGDVSDTREIGVDNRGRDWGTVGQWAQLRVDNGHSEPIGVMYYEIGNEFYGGVAGAGTDCPSFGWEEVWTCDGTEYVNGIDGEDGFLTYVQVMKGVDPEIQIGAIGVSGQTAWENWGVEVLTEAGDVMDFYVIHEYGFDSTPLNEQAVLARPFEIWGPVMDDYRETVAEVAGGRDIPVAVTEYNLFAFQEADDTQIMKRLMNAMFIADSIGQMATHGVDWAMQWDLMNGTANNGTDYGLISFDDLSRNPQYYVFPLWNRFGETLYPVENPFDPTVELSVYGGQVDDDTYSLLVINKTFAPITADLALNGVASFTGGEAYIVQSDNWWAEEVTYNGISNPAADLENAPPIALDSGETVTFEALSITLLHLDR